ncbi:MAG: dTDP-4-dehydrorhamnose reductase [Nitrospiraceae bacterium]|nr:MAG: dTDP-4-dehydrorhamnose reductase [Nitrospiraceae bacterium]
MRILITGANGQLGYDLQRTLTSHELILMDFPAFDLTKPSCEEQVVNVRPDVVIHAAAYTDVDGAELQPDLAMAVNALGTEWVARGAARVKARLLYISTDYVFDGLKRTPYLENDPANPLSLYGKSKLEGECRALAHCPNSLVVRTSWLYGAHGKNFVKTMMRLAMEQSELRVVADQRGCPTNAADLAQSLARMLTPDIRGIVHATGGGDCTWCELASAIVSAMGQQIPVHPITTAQAGRRAARPRYSVLANCVLKQSGISLPAWSDSLVQFVKSGAAPTVA